LQEFAGACDLLAKMGKKDIAVHYLEERMKIEMQVSYHSSGQCYAAVT
jgi:hypothetical protein